MKEEIQRRQSLKSKLRELLTANPGQWFSMNELAKLGGLGGWRTRLSELGCGDNPMNIEWNGKNGSASAHRYQPLGPSAETKRDDKHPAIRKKLFR